MPKQIRMKRKNPIKTSPAEKLYTSSGEPVAAAADVNVVQVDEANSNGELDAGNTPVASSALVRLHVVVEISILKFTGCPADVEIWRLKCLSHDCATSAGLLAV